MAPHRGVVVRVRIKQSSVNGWDIEVWHWWWPFWIEQRRWLSEKDAIAFAKILKDPMIVEIK